MNTYIDFTFSKLSTSHSLGWTEPLSGCPGVPSGQCRDPLQELALVEARSFENHHLNPSRTPCSALLSLPSFIPRTISDPMARTLQGMESGVPDPAQGQRCQDRCTARSPGPVRDYSFQELDAL